MSGKHCYFFHKYVYKVYSIPEYNSNTVNSILILVMMGKTMTTIEHLLSSLCFSEM